MLAIVLSVPMCQYLPWCTRKENIFTVYKQILKKKKEIYVQYIHTYIHTYYYLCIVCTSYYVCVYVYIHTKYITTIYYQFTQAVCQSPFLQLNNVFLMQQFCFKAVCFVFQLSVPLLSNQFLRFYFQFIRICTHPVLVPMNN